MLGHEGGYAVCQLLPGDSCKKALMLFTDKGRAEDSVHGVQEYLTDFRDLLLTPNGLELQPYSFERMLHRISHPVPLLLAA